MLAQSPFTYTPTGADWLHILPELILLVAVFATLLADLALPEGRKSWLAAVGIVGVLVSGWSLIYVSGFGVTSAFYGMISTDGVALFSAAVILLSLGLALLLSPGYVTRQKIRREGEYYVLLQLAALGMMLMAAATNLMTIFVGLETLSLSLYVLCALPQTRLRSQESGMKYFILSSFASAFLLFGMSLIYGATGSTAISDISTFLIRRQSALSQGFAPLLIVGMSLMVVGFGFKVSAVPFQAWTPDVYTGAPTTVTAFMSVGTKVAAFAALARVFIQALQTQHSHWQPVMWALAALTMVVGNLLAVTQRDVKRMLAYSSVATAGYLLVAIATGSQRAMASLFFYLAAYAVMNIGAFGVTLLVERGDGRGTTLEDFNGLGRRNPALAALMAVFLFSLAGVPPTAGFLAKYFVFYAAIVDNQTPLAIIGILASVLGMFYYLRVVWAMYFVEPSPGVAPVPLMPLPEPALAAVSVTANGAREATEPAPADAPTRIRREVIEARSTLTSVRIATPLSSAVSLGIAVVITLLLILAAGPLDAYAQTAAAVLFR
ncbi:MAG TPA: NADH-quinone oxidoreductase subunit N [Ktedonobacterales bacterium]|nr:NADH-quinone oxidoreductase subunit N [Ktedonobacterales bacterium]